MGAPTPMSLIVGLDRQLREDGLDDSNLLLHIA
jgi:hypothetical protein